jgi:hypothetical protein
MSRIAKREWPVARWRRLAARQYSWRSIRTIDDLGDAFAIVPWIGSRVILLWDEADDSADLEDLGVVASRLRGRVRLVSLDKTWYAAAELRALLGRMTSAEPEILNAAASVRRRPRRPGKPL